MPINPSQLADELSSTQFENLLRFYLARTTTRVGAHRRRHTAMTFSCSISEDGVESCRWQIGNGYSDDPRTDGEILSSVVIEHCRRLGFAETCKLNLIEGTITVPPSKDVEVPF